MNVLVAVLVLSVRGQAGTEDIQKNLDLYLKRWAEEYVSYIITDAERRLLSQLMTPEEKLVFIENFWRRRDPTPETPENEYRDAYAQRFQYANAHFRTARPGWKIGRAHV